MKVLLVEDDAASMSYLEIVVKKEGHSYEKAYNGLDGLETFRAYNPDIVLSDISMANMDGLEMLKRIKFLKPDCIVIMLTAFNSEDYVVKAMQNGANNYLKKPAKRQELSALLRKYTAQLENMKQVKNVAVYEEEHTFSMKFKSNIEIIPAVCTYLINETGSCFEEDVALDVKLGLGELILNAVEHGNLGISFSEKNDAVHADILQNLYIKRLLDPELADKNVEIYYEKSNNACKWVITDQGQGFDPESIPNPLSEEGILRLHGRGIFICKFHFDELFYNEKGNQVTVIKRIEK